jgi:hypothetical protein
MSEYLPYGIAALILYAFVSSNSASAMGDTVPGSYDMQSVAHSGSYDATGPKPTKNIAGASLPPEYHAISARRGATRPYGYPSTNLSGAGKARMLVPIETPEDVHHAVPVEHTADTAYAVPDTAYPLLPSDALHQSQNSNQDEDY